MALSRSLDSEFAALCGRSESLRLIGSEEQDALLRDLAPGAYAGRRICREVLRQELAKEREGARRAREAVRARGSVAGIGDIGEIGEFVRARLGVDLDPVQEALLQSDRNRVILCCARQWGKSTVSAAKALYLALTRPNTQVIIGSPSERQSDLLLEKVKEMMRRLDIAPRGDGVHARSVLLPNGSRIVALPGNERTVRGFSKVSLLILDEAARIPDELYHALLPLIAVGDGAVWQLSTPYGRRGFFYETWESHSEGWLRVSVSGPDCPRIAEAQLAFQRSQMGERMYAQEYLCQFLDAEEALIGVEFVDRALRPDVPMFVPYGRGPQPETAHENVKWRRMYAGVDLGRDTTPTAIALVEKKFVLTGERSGWDLSWLGSEHVTVRYLERLPLGTSFVEIVRRVRDLARDPNVMPWSPEVYVDATGVGAPVLEALRGSDLLCPVYGVKITAGEQDRKDGQDWRIPRVDLLARLCLLLEKEQLGVAGGLPLWPDLRKELWGLRVRERPRGTLIETVAQRDDLAFAVALAAWGASHEAKEMSGKRRLL